MVDEIIVHFCAPAPISDLVMLESMTLSLPSLPGGLRQESIDMFVLHFPMLRKLTLVELPEKPQVHCLLAIVASFQVPVVYFDAPLSNIYISNIASLFSIVGEVTFCG